jgi:hypothetical protein
MAIIQTRWGVRRGDDPFYVESQSCYARWDANNDPANLSTPVEGLPKECFEPANSELFRQEAHRCYLCDREYGVAEYCDLPRTFSNVLALGQQDRTGLLTGNTNLIVRRFGARILRHDLYDLWVAKTSKGREGS